MIHKHIKSLPHHPTRVITISFIVAIIIGTWGYLNINKQPVAKLNQSDSVSIAKDVSLSFSIPGKVSAVLVRVGDQVKRGDILAELIPDNMDGALIQAKATYEIAKANYEKVINGATGPTIDIAKTAVNTAKINLDQITKQQNILVDNAYRNLLNSSPEAVPDDSYNNGENYVAPTISGNYGLGKEGTIKLHFYSSAGGVAFDTSGLTGGVSSCNTITPQPIGNSGLYITCPDGDRFDTEDWNIEIPNKKSPDYLKNLNAYELATQTRDQSIAIAQATLDQANANLASITSTTRSEDIAIVKAQVENAEGALKSNATYSNTVIIAPYDGTVTAVVIRPGQIAVPNASAIDLKTDNLVN